MAQANCSIPPSIGAQLYENLLKGKTIRRSGLYLTQKFSTMLCQKHSETNGNVYRQLITSWLKKIVWINSGNWSRFHSHTIIRPQMNDDNVPYTRMTQLLVPQMDSSLWKRHSTNQLQLLLIHPDKLSNASKLKKDGPKVILLLRNSTK